MKKYLLGRFVRSIVSVIAVVCIAIVMVYTMIPKEKVFLQDPNINKLMGDARTVYMYTKWRDLGYLDFARQQTVCSASSDYDSCMAGKGDFEVLLKTYTDKGYNTETLQSGETIIYREYNPFELITGIFGNMIKVDNPNVVQDPDNPNLERKYYIKNGPNGLPAVACSGCTYEYQLYVNSSFPFIHQNALKLNFGKSYPTFSGLDTMDVINSGQGDIKMSEVTFPTGVTSNSPLNLYTCQYKNTSTLDKMDKNRFPDNYAKCLNNYSDLSMTGNSYLFGIIALILAYVVALPAGIVMAQKKDKWQDKLGIVYINLMIAVPSLAFILFAKQLGNMAGLPDKFPQLGASDPRSYILPILILGLLSTAGIMIWIRRYMIDQSNSDYVKFARAKGLSQREIFRKHILKNAIIPIVNGIPSSIILCISGSVITESVFAIPGMGKMLPDSIKAYNNNMVITLTFIFTALSVFSLLLGDVLMTFVDPRIQLSSKGDSR